MSDCKEGKLCYGCLFCTTGKERLVSRGIETTCPGVLSLIHIFACDSVICQEAPDDDAVNACQELGAALV